MLVVEPEEDVAQEVDGGGVGPVDVVDEHHRGRGAHVLEHEVGQPEQLAGPLPLDRLGRDVVRRFEFGVGTGPLDQRDVVVPTTLLPERARDRGEQRVAEGEVGEVEVVVAATAQHRGAPVTGVLERFLSEAGLADPRLAFDDHEVREAAERLVDAVAQPAQFGTSSDQRARHAVSVQVTGR